MKIIDITNNKWPIKTLKRREPLTPFMLLVVFDSLESLCEFLGVSETNESSGIKIIAHGISFYFRAEYSEILKRKLFSDKVSEENKIPCIKLVYGSSRNLPYTMISFLSKETIEDLYK